ncbi:MAG: hypothetical protein J7L96_05985, partial [Bacteroidales bacterium]|nr:hypothetical protein [Bacteroidales bacterium]
MKNLIRILLLGVLALMVTYCQPNKPSGESGNQAFAAYIQGHTAGVISGGDNIRIYLAQALTGFVAGDELPAKLLTFSPGVSGKAWYLKDGLIEFQPDERLSNGEEYEVSFSLGKLYQLPKELRDFSFSFEVLPLDFSVQKAGVAISGKNGDEIEVSGRVRTADFIEKDVLEDCFSIESANGSPAFSIEEAGENIFTYRISDLSRLDDNYSIKLVWNGRTHKIDQKGEMDITIPGRNQFEILNVVVEQGVDQHIRIDFSSAVDPQQDMEGLIYLAGYDNIKLRRSANQVYLYPLTRITGEWDLNLEGSLRNTAGKNLGEKQLFTLAMDALPPQVQFLGSGYILPNS